MVYGIWKYDDLSSKENMAKLFTEILARRDSGQEIFWPGEILARRDSGQERFCKSLLVGVPPTLDPILALYQDKPALGSDPRTDRL